MLRYGFQSWSTAWPSCCTQWLQCNSTITCLQLNNLWKRMSFCAMPRETVGLSCSSSCGSWKVSFSVPHSSKDSLSLLAILHASWTTEWHRSLSVCSCSCPLSPAAYLTGALSFPNYPLNVDCDASGKAMHSKLRFQPCSQNERHWYVLCIQLNIFISLLSNTCLSNEGICLCQFS